jgi:hypothetical protein
LAKESVESILIIPERLKDRKEFAAQPLNLSQPTLGHEDFRQSHTCQSRIQRRASLLKLPPGEDEDGFRFAVQTHPSKSFPFQPKELGSRQGRGRIPVELSRSTKPGQGFSRVSVLHLEQGISEVVGRRVMVALIASLDEEVLSFQKVAGGQLELATTTVDHGPVDEGTAEGMMSTVPVINLDRISNKLFRLREPTLGRSEVGKPSNKPGAGQVVGLIGEKPYRHEKDLLRQIEVANGPMSGTGDPQSVELKGAPALFITAVVTLLLGLGASSVLYGRLIR